MFFSNIANFNTISETLDRCLLVELISEYLQTVSEIITSHGGVLDKYVGDLVMAFWNAPMPIEDHPFRACEAALESRSRLHELTESKFFFSGIYDDDSILGHQRRIFLIHE